MGPRAKEVAVNSGLAQSYKDTISAMLEGVARLGGPDLIAMVVRDIDNNMPRDGDSGPVDELYVDFICSGVRTNNREGLKALLEELHQIGWPDKESLDEEKAKELVKAILDLLLEDRHQGSNDAISKALTEAAVNILREVRQETAKQLLSGTTGSAQRVKVLTLIMDQ